jgi:hypothetical protein
MARGRHRPENLLFFEKGQPTTDIWFWEHRVPDGKKAYSMTKPIRFEHLSPLARSCSCGCACDPDPPKQ